MTDPIIIRPTEPIPPPPKANFRYLVDAVNNLLVDGQTTRDLIDSSNFAQSEQIKELQKQIKILIMHQEISTDNEIVEADIVNIIE